MEIRKATMYDIDTILELYYMLFTSQSELKPNFIQLAEQDADFIEKMINEETSEIFLATIDSEIVGFVVTQEQETLPYSCIIQHKFRYYGKGTK